MTDQKTLFCETHCADVDQISAATAQAGRGAPRPRLRAWCGKSVSLTALNIRNTEPTCWQCKQIWQRTEGKTKLGAVPAPELADVTAGPGITLQQTAALLMSHICPHCGAGKMYHTVFCGVCYKRLPRGLQRRLYQRHGHGFEEAYSEARACLAQPVPAA